MKNLMTLTLLLFICQGLLTAQADKSWYTQGDFEPVTRIEFELVNTLDLERENCPVIIKRSEFPIKDVHEMWVTVVDPSLPPSDAPSEELLNLQGGHQLRAESNGHAVFHQMDDLDKDGIWDELFFQTDLKPLEKKTIYIYMGENIRGWNKHYTHANIGSYCRHQMPFWESENVGWKIWFANSVDVFAKRKPTLMSQLLYMENIDGYGVSVLDNDYGSDIQGVAETFGGGAICLFENPDDPGIPSRPRFTPVQAEKSPESLWNAGQISDTRYAYEVVTNGPLRSMIKIKTMNWNTGNGSYAVEQIYTAYAHQSYSTCRVKYNLFAPQHDGVLMGCGIRKKPEEKWVVTTNDLILSAGPEIIKDPEKIDDREEYRVDFIGSAITVKDIYEPEYQFVDSRGENHTFKINNPLNNGFEYMIFSAWSEGAVLNTNEEFSSYVENTQKEFNSPVKSIYKQIEKKAD
ncbi:MAG TPA: DUF4861 family protein [Bacteroidales bacterium]|nr:DUF4861 family protein [Bacteroidales bacterium]